VILLVTTPELLPELHLIIVLTNVGVVTMVGVVFLNPIVVSSITLVTSPEDTLVTVLGTAQVTKVSLVTLLVTSLGNSSTVIRETPIMRSCYIQE